MNNNCPICNSKEFTKEFVGTIEESEWLLNGKKYSYQSCNNCGFINSNPIPTDEELIDFYKNVYAYEWFKKNSYYKNIQAKHRFYKIRKYTEGCRKVLDFGCGHGFFVEQMAKTNLNSFGFDIGVDKIINNHGYQIVYKNKFSDFKEKDFDLITAWHVIEHMRDLNQVIEDIKDRLNDKGKLIIAVPNTGSLGFKLFKQKWGWIQQPYLHINHFNERNLSSALKNHGFSIIDIVTTDTWDQNLYDLLITKFFYKNKSRNTVRDFSANTGGNFTFRINQLVRLAFTPVSYLYSWLRKSRYEGSELMVIAQKS